MSGGIDNDDFQRSLALVPHGTVIPDDMAYKAALTVCDPLHGLTVEQASEVLCALGLKHKGEDT